MDENDPHWDADPLWYDRSEPEAAPGVILNGVAYAVLLVLAGLACGMRVYRLPDRLWCRAAARLTRPTARPRRS